jgi:spermidine synthase
LLLVSVLTLPFWKRGLAGAALLALPIVAGSIWPGLTAIAAGNPGELLNVDTPYHHISVIDTELDHQDARLMCFDRFVESAIAKSPPHPSLEQYTNYFHLAFLVNAKIEKSLFLGAGGGVGPRAFHMQNPDMAIDVVDIDPKVLELARTHFFLDDRPLAHERIKTFAEDGRMFVRRVESRYDCVVLDAFSAGGRIPFHLVTQEFLELCRDKMTDDGVFIMNVNSAIDGPLAQIFHSMYRTIDSVFPNIYVFAMDHRNVGEHESTNLILMATRRKQRIAPEQWPLLAKAHQSNSYVTSDRLQQMAQDLLADLPDTASAPIFSDDYAPIETMSF